ncbi:hypothetical protein [Herbiconiux sp. L3-i23]|jgi:hypothetical protein|uniref:hypothetical protein n=1 Tax=Herbiconiux sp. L3-i23 TaxID=2905871 RepID=UPI002059C30E|nr:hypothetical protein [Herbiconiux sp. L3-i23]BDI23767.1 hypothetical protein L3i23_25430 [Herbiconiux sp. L3-i23]
MGTVDHARRPRRVSPAGELLEVTKLDDHSWTVCDSRRDPSDAMRLLAFIEARRECYRVTWLAGGRGWNIYSEFPIALRAIRVRCLDQGLDD